MMDKISEDIKLAMKAQDKIKLNALRYIKKLLIENKTSTKPVNEMDIVISHAKKLKDSLSIYPADSSQRKDLEDEINVLQEYLPQALSEAEVLDIIKEIKDSMAAPTFPLIMKEIQVKIKGRFDGKRATELIKSALE